MQNTQLQKINRESLKLHCFDKPFGSFDGSVAFSPFAFDSARVKKRPLTGTGRCIVAQKVA